ncbi:hypothetical protein [Streptomyces hundungensis]|uniref:hypothetical protein n=1 Tax=Streptomyces hundungensis TaxID=1077946 RepID=UPI0033C3FF32
MGQRGTGDVERPEPEAVGPDHGHQGGYGPLTQPDGVGRHDGQVHVQPGMPAFFDHEAHTLAASGIAHKKTRSYRPQTNGKAGRLTLAPARLGITSITSVTWG